MKKRFCLLMFLLTGLIVYGQNNDSPVFNQSITTNDKAQIRALSPITSLMLKDQKRWAHQADGESLLLEKYALIKQNDVLYAKAFIRADGEISKDDLDHYGALYGLRTHYIFTALVPVNQIIPLSQHPKVLNISIAEKANHLIDTARITTRVNQVHSGLSLPRGYKGEGIVVGIVDIGFDYTHPTFFDSTGKNGYRVKRVWNQIDTNGTPPAGFNYGTLLTNEAEILAAKTDRSNEIHGTHVAGIAVGSGGEDSSRFVGVAPKSDIVFVATDATTVGLMEGIDYIQQYADSVGKPSVVNLSWGSHVGPHDGTSNFDLVSDSFLVGPGKILVGATGNEGRPHNTIFLENNYTSNNLVMYTFIAFGESLNAKGTAYTDVWGEPGKDFLGTVHLYDATGDSIVHTAPYLFSASADSSVEYKLYDTINSSDTCYVYLETGIDINNNKPRILIAVQNNIKNADSLYALIELHGNNTTTKMWATKGVFTHLGKIAPFKNGTNTSTVGELGGSGKSMISTGAYTTRSHWDSYSKGKQSVDATVGAKAAFSSMGPTADGRMKPDIMAPGEMVVSSVNSFHAGWRGNSVNAIDKVSDSTKDWWFATGRGTSMAAPVTAGVVALWLEARPDLSPDEIKKIMKGTALKDRNTGTITANGSNVWGWGKLNAWVEIDSMFPAKPVISPWDTTICAGNLAVLEAPVGYYAYEWTSGAASQLIMVDSSGSFQVRVTNDLGLLSEWSDTATVTVNPMPASVSITRFADTLISSADSGNQWYKDDVAIAGATQKKYTLTDAGFYRVEVTNEFDCTRKSGTMQAEPNGGGPGGINALGNIPELEVYPNPAHDFLFLKFNEMCKDVSYTIYDLVGRKQLTGHFQSTNKGQIQKIDLLSLSSGVYAVNLWLDGKNYTIKIMVEK